MAKPRKVLIIEDELRARQAIARAFTMDEEFKFEVTGVATVEEATDILKKAERRFDLLVIDWKLDPEGEGGLRLLEAGKIYLPKIKIIYTAYATLEDCVKAMKAGADDYIDKNQPDSLKKLLESAKEEIKAWEFEEHEPDPQWLNEHLEELRAKYHGELIAFIDGKVVAHAPTKRELLKKVKEKYPDEEPFIMFAPVEVYDVSASM